MLKFINGHDKSIFNRTIITKDYFIRLSTLFEEKDRLHALRLISVEE